LNVALRQEMDLYQCVRPVRYFKGVPSPLKDPSKTDMVIYRENTEDIYAGIEWAAETDNCRKIIDFLQNQMGVKKIRFPRHIGNRYQASIPRGYGAPGSCRDQVRHCQQAQVGDPGAQRQHHEIHRGRVPRLGLCLGEE
jgi:hypothetical protein